MDNLKYTWQQAYLAALTEVNPERLAARVELADDAVFDRLFELEKLSDAQDERASLEDTMGYLRLLRSHSYHFPS